MKAVKSDPDNVNETVKEVLDLLAQDVMHETLPERKKNDRNLHRCHGAEGLKESLQNEVKIDITKKSDKLGSKKLWASATMCHCSSNSHAIKPPNQNHDDGPSR